MVSTADFSMEFAMIFLESGWTALTSCPFDQVAEAIEPGAYVGSEVHAYDAAAALDEHVQVTLRLEPLQNPEAVLLARDRRVLGVVARDLQEDSVVLPA